MSAEMDESDQPPEIGTGRKPRPTGTAAAMPPVQIALGVFILFLFLLVLWLVWPLLGGGG